MNEKKNGVISISGTTSSIAEYIWNSPCLKPLIFNPFLVSVLILCIIWLVDFSYGKKLQDDSACTHIQHIITTLILVMCGIAMNNILIKHYYRMQLYEKKKNDSTLSETISEEVELIPYESDSNDQTII